MTKFLNIFSNEKTREEKLKIIVDNREKNSFVITELRKLGFEIEFRQLPVGDYIINNTAIERKTLSDFKSSIINKRLISQLYELKQYPSHMLLLEGLESEYPYSSGNGLHENAFRGFLLSIISEFRTPIIYTLNEQDTAKYLYVLARKKTKKEESIRPSKILLSEKEQLQFILEGFPQIGPATAKKLLKHFKTLKKLANSSEKKLDSIIGKKAEALYKLLNKKY